jgi:hypothetical protein
MQPEDLPAVIGSPSGNGFAQWMGIDTHGTIVSIH